MSKDTYLTESNSYAINYLNVPSKPSVSWELSRSMCSRNVDERHRWLGGSLQTYSSYLVSESDTWLSTTHSSNGTDGITCPVLFVKEN